MSNINKLLTALFGDQIQDLENAFRQMLFRLDIDNSIGIQLDGIGKIIDEPRQGLSDIDYRVILKVKIGILNSKGTIEDIVNAWRLITGSDNVEVKEAFPAKIRLLTDQYLDSDTIAILLDRIKDILAGGVGLDNIIVDDPTRFGFGSSRGYFGSNWPDSYV